MLLRYNVSNFLSFNEEVEFCMYTGKDDNFSDRVVNINGGGVLKFGAIYGANASGKSNLIKSIDFAKDIITKGIQNLDTIENIKFLVFNNDVGSKFEFEIKLDDRIYAYGFIIKLDSKEFMGEWLYEITKEGEKLLFERNLCSNKINVEMKFENKENYVKFSVYCEDSLTMKETLLLSEITRKKIRDDDFNVFVNIYNWFKYKLIIIYPSTKVGIFTTINSSSKELLKLLKYFDTGIIDFEKETISINAIGKMIGKNKIDRLIQYTNEHKLEEIYGIIKTKKSIYEFANNNGDIVVDKLLFIHSDKNKRFELSDESDGTQRLIEFLDIVSRDYREKVFIIDEIDRSFHPQMTKKIIETYFKSNCKNESQLVVTLHEANLLDFKIMRKDEIWFVEKNIDSSSKIYSLENFSLSTDKISMNYLNGRFGAIPEFKDYDSYIGENL